MNKFNLTFCSLAATLIFSCNSTHVGLKENWIDEGDMIDLASTYVSDWIVKAGRPTLVEINGDTSIYYYNYRPTMYATTIYDGTAKETKPSLENATEVWGSRKDIMQIKVVSNIAISAVITDGPDKKIYIRDLNGDFILDPTSGYNSNVSEEQKIGGNSELFKNAYSKLYNKDSNATKVPAGTNMSPWEYYRYKQQLEAKERADSIATELVAHTAAQPAAHVATEPAAPVATEPANHPQATGH